MKCIFMCSDSREPELRLAADDLRRRLWFMLGHLLISMKEIFYIIVKSLLNVDDNFNYVLRSRYCNSYKEQVFSYYDMI